MSARLFQLNSFLTYWLDAVDDHSLHSPFLYDFYHQVLKKKISHPDLDVLKQTKKELQRDHRIIHVADLGAGSTHLKSSERKVSDIANISTSSEKFSKLYRRLISHYHSDHIIELGTSIGINTMYLATSHSSVKVATFEGSSEIATIAKQLFREHNITNIEVVEGNIDETLPAYLTHVEKIDFAFIDANHRLEPTLRYAESIIRRMHASSILVLDDIHYSPEMERAWHTIKNYQQAYTTIDLFRCGLVFFNPALNKQNVVLQF